MISFVILLFITVCASIYLVYIIKSDDSEAPLVIKGGAIKIDGKSFSVGSAPVVIRDGRTISINDGDVVIDGRAMSISPGNFHFDDHDFGLSEISEFPDLSRIAAFPEIPEFPKLLQESRDS